MSGAILTSVRLLRAGVRHGFTTRQLGDALSDLSGWERESGLRRESLVRLQQVHGIDVLVVDRPAGRLAPEEQRRFDASVTDLKDVILSVRTADCVPILLYSPEPAAAAAVHAGWRGTLRGTVGRAVSALVDVYRCRAKDLLAVIGPCIHSCCYRVGPEVHRPFVDRFGPEVMIARGRDTFLDLVAANRRWLIEAGVRESGVEVLDLCTHCRADLFFSHRREGSTGRQLAFIAL